MPPPPIQNLEIEKKEVYICDLCDEAYDTETELPFHMKECHKSELLNNLEKHKCWICLKLYNSSEEVIAHIKVCHLYSSPNARRIERETYVCDNCAQVFLNKTFLINHILYYHTPKNDGLQGKVTCHICNELKSRQYIWHHCRGHKLLSLSCCLICFKKCKNQKALELHQEQHTHYLHCDMCAFETKKRITFVEHVYNHDRHLKNIEDVNEDETVSDKIMLQRMFRPEGDMGPWATSHFSHLTGIKLPNGIKICILCREICTSKEEMLKHLYNHKLLSVAEDIKKYHICECGQEFPSNILLRHHKLQEEKEAKKEERREEEEVSPETREIVFYKSAKNKHLTVSPETREIVFYKSAKNKHLTDDENEENPKRLRQNYETL